MIRAVIRFSAHNRFLVLLATALFVGYGVYTLNHIPVDAIPDLSDTQVIVYSRWDRSPDIMEDQVTYPIVTALLGAPRGKAIRGFSDFGFSYVSLIFQDWYLRYWLQSVPGVAEVVSIGGFQKQYQVNVDPNAMVALKIPLQRVV